MYKLTKPQPSDKLEKVEPKGVFPFVIQLSVSLWSNYVYKSNVSASGNSSQNAANQKEFEN